MYFVMKIIATVVISVMMQAGTESIVATTPREAVLDFMEGLENRDTYVMEKYMDDSYVNFITNVQGDEAVVERMNDALFSGFTYKIEDMAVKNDVAVSIAADNRIDNRVLFSAGKAALRINAFPEKVRVCFGIPLSVSGKSLFFDRPAIAK